MGRGRSGPLLPSDWPQPNPTARRRTESSMTMSGRACGAHTCGAAQQRASLDAKGSRRLCRVAQHSFGAVLPGQSAACLALALNVLPEFVGVIVGRPKIADFVEIRCWRHSLPRCQVVQRLRLPELGAGQSLVHHARLKLDARSLRKVYRLNRAKHPIFKNGVDDIAHGWHSLMHWVDHTTMATGLHHDGA